MLLAPIWHAVQQLIRLFDNQVGTLWVGKAIKSSRTNRSSAWWCTPLITALEKLSPIRISLKLRAVNIASSRPARAPECDPVSKKSTEITLLSNCVYSWVYGERGICAHACELRGQPSAMFFLRSHPPGNEGLPTGLASPQRVIHFYFSGTGITQAHWQAGFWFRCDDLNSVGALGSYGKHLLCYRRDTSF